MYAVDETWDLNQFNRAKSPSEKVSGDLWRMLSLSMLQGKWKLCVVARST